MDVYSLALAFALVAGGGGLLAVFSGQAREPTSRSHRVGRVGGILGLVLVLAALVVRLFWGHRPGTAQSLGPIQFAGEHPALIAAGILAAVALWGSRAK